MTTEAEHLENVQWAFERVRQNGAAADEACRIVVDLANSEPPLDGEFGCCTLCSTDNRGGRFGVTLETEPADHEPTCPWRRSVELVRRYNEQIQATRRAWKRAAEMTD